MEKPERLIGYVEYESTNFPFEFHEDSFTITLFPPTLEIWEEATSINNIFSRINSNNKEHKWIGSKELTGITAKGRKIVFGIQDLRSNYNGFHSYPVNWYFYCSQELDLDAIDGFKLVGREIEYFFPPNQVLNQSINFDKETGVVKEISVNSTEEIAESCGKYRIIPHVDASIEVSAYGIANINNDLPPLTSKSIMTTTFSAPVSLHTLLEAFHYSVCFLQYITYRKNIDLDSIEVFKLDEKGLRNYLGILVFEKSNSTEAHPKANERIIDFSLLKYRTAKLYTLIKNRKLAFQHLCDSIDDRRHYPPSRIIMILSSFEREFRNIYGQNSERSEIYLNVQNDIVSLIDNYIVQKHGKARNYAKQFKKYVENRDSSFESNLKKALLDCKDVMLPFIRRKYVNNYEEAVDGISERMGTVRNGIAHSRLDFKIDAIHLSDLRIVQEILYVIRLKNMHLSTKEIQKAINKLFGENFAI